jgi:hypothetical protein
MSPLHFTLARVVDYHRESAGVGLRGGASPCGVLAPPVGMAGVEDEFLAIDREICSLD